MKKILLLIALSCFLIMQTEIVFGKCQGILVYTTHNPDSVGGEIFSGDIICISPGELITSTYYCLGSFCYCITNPTWYLNDTIIQQNSSPLIITIPGEYKFASGSCGNCGLSVTFNVALFPTGIPNLTSSSLPFPFSNSLNINPTNLRYTIINPLGQIMEQGKFSGEIILRNGNHRLQPGIYFVIYSDALDNRQVLTDKVFVSGQ